MGDLPTRRTIVRGSSAAALLALAGCLSDAAPADDDPDSSSSDADDADDGDDGLDEPVTVYVGVDSVEAFDPRKLAIPPVTTVRFVWASDGHALTVEEQPDGADVGGVPEERGEGYEHEVTLDVEGEYAFATDDGNFYARVGDQAHLPEDDGEPDPLPEAEDWTDREEGTIDVGPGDSSSSTRPSSR